MGTAARLTALGVFCGTALLAGLFLLLGPPELLAKSESVDFCASCHIHEKQHTAFLHSGAHRRKLCVDCHLPNQDVATHFFWKGIDGMKDVYFFYSGTLSDPIRITDHGSRVLQENCIRCHEEMTSRISLQRRCWDCHRSVNHTLTGEIATVTY